jgi:hypothetical protein
MKTALIVAQAFKKHPVLGPSIEALRLRFETKLATYER